MRKGATGDPFPRYRTLSLRSRQGTIPDDTRLMPPKPGVRNAKTCFACSATAPYGAKKGLEHDQKSLAPYAVHKTAVRICPKTCPQQEKATALPGRILSFGGRPPTALALGPGRWVARRGWPDELAGTPAVQILQQRPRDSRPPPPLNGRRQVEEATCHSAATELASSPSPNPISQRRILVRKMGAK